MSAFADLVRFTPTLGGTTDWIYSSAVGGCQSPSAANVQNGLSYKVYAVSTDLTQWEVSQGVYNSSTGTFPRTTVLYNSSGTGTATGQSGAGTKISFTTVPQVMIVALAEDLPNDPNSAWTAYTPSLSADSGTFTTATPSGRYKQIGKTVFVQIQIVITTVGTAAGGVHTSLPTTPNGWAVFTGKEGSINGKAFGGSTNGNTSLTFTNYDNTSPIAAGATLVMNGVYEST